MLTTTAFTGLLAVEILYLTLTFDTEGLERLPAAWAALADWPAQSLRLAVTIALTTVAIGGQGLWTSFQCQFRAHDRGRPTVAVLLGAHVGALALFTWISAGFFSVNDSVQRAPALWASAWVASGAATFLLWSHALLPLDRWVGVLRSHRGAIACGAAVGSVAWTFGFVSETLWEPLAFYTYRVLGWMLGLFYSEVVNNPATLELGTPAFSVEIAHQCSGYEGIGLIVVFLSLYLFFFRHELRFPAALVLLPLGVISIWLLNLVRIVALIAIGDAGWPHVAFGGFHSQAGWIAFNTIGLGFVALTRKGHYFARDSVAQREQAGDSTSPYLAPFLSLLAVAMVTGAISAGFDWWYPAKLMILAIVLWTFRRCYASLNWQASWAGVACGVTAFVIWIALLPEVPSDKAAWPAALQSVGSVWAAAWLATRTVGYVIAVPLAEELAFRGYLTRRFWLPDVNGAQVGTFAWSAFLLSSAIFGAFHGQLWLAGTLVGMLYALALYRRRSLGDAVLAHAVTNGLIAIYVFTTGHWSAWS
jgi:exosortase E/protease (VPEID-CTERM system)